MNINCYLVSKGEFEKAVIPEELLIGLCKNLREKGIETVHFKDRSIQVEGIYISAKGVKNTLIVVPDEEH